MKTHVNMLPVSHFRARIVRRRLALWSLVWMIVVGIGAAAWWSSYVRFTTAARQFEDRQRRYAPIRKLLSENEEMQRQIDELGKRESILGGLNDRHPPLSAVGLISRCARQCNQRLRVERFVLERSDSALPAETQLASTRASSLLTLEGKGSDNLAVAAFVEALRDTAAFARVDLKSTIRTGADSDDMRHFIVTCEF